MAAAFRVLPGLWAVGRTDIRPPPRRPQKRRYLASIMCPAMLSAVDGRAGSPATSTPTTFYQKWTVAAGTALHTVCPLLRTIEARHGCSLPGSSGLWAAGAQIYARRPAATQKRRYLASIMKLRAKSPPLSQVCSSMAVDQAMLEPMPSCTASRCSVTSARRLSSCSWRAA